jgi:hypothetical protein
MVSDLKPDTFDVKFPSPDQTITDKQFNVAHFFNLGCYDTEKRVGLKKCELVIMICTAILMFHQCKNKTQQKYGFKTTKKLPANLTILFVVF